MEKKVRVLFDIDVCKDISKQFAICYALANINKLDILGFTIAPFRNTKKPSDSVRDSLIDSKNEINHILRLFGNEKPLVFIGSDGFCSDGYEDENPAVKKIIECTKTEKDFVVCCLGGLTNVAVALSHSPKIAEKLNVVWFGTENLLLDSFNDANFLQDKQAFYKVLESKANLTIFPSYLADSFVTSKYEFNENTTENDVTHFLRTLLSRCDYIKNEKEIKTVQDLGPIAFLLHKNKFCLKKLEAKLFDKENVTKLPSDREVEVVTDIPKNSFVWLDFLKSINGIKNKFLKPCVFFTSDTHFGHERKIRFKEVPFKSVDEMNDELVRRWNRVVGPNDLVYHIGDFGDYNFVKKLNGKVVLICGNYEKCDFRKHGGFANFRNKLLLLGFADVIENGLILDEELFGEKVFLTHKPTNRSKEYMTLFGHVHSLNLVKEFGFNVCCSYHYFAPISLKSAKLYFDFVKNHADKDVFV